MVSSLKLAAQFRAKAIDMSHQAKAAHLASALSCIVTTGPAVTTGPNIGKFPHTVNGSGGVAPYTGTGVFYDFSATYSAIITDTNGCTAMATG